MFDEISEKVGYDCIEMNNDMNKIPNIKSLDSDAQKLIIFDDFICQQNQKPMIEYFIGGRHKNCSIIYLSQSFFNTSKPIRLNCSNFCIGGFTTKREKQSVCKEIGVTLKQLESATLKPFQFLTVDNNKKRVTRNFNGGI